MQAYFDKQVHFYQVRAIWFSNSEGASGESQKGTLGSRSDSEISQHGGKSTWLWANTLKSWTHCNQQMSTGTCTSG